MQHPVLPLVPQGAAYFPAKGKAAPGKYLFLLLPGFTLLAFSCALEPFRIANQLSQKPLYHWRVVSQDGESVASSSGIALQVDGALEPADRDTTLFVCSGTLNKSPVLPRTLSLIARHHRFGGKVGGICTGADALAHAGLLTNVTFTLHWENQPAFAERFPDLPFTGRKVEIDQRILTCGGGAAATDLALRLIEQDHGQQFSSAVCDMCLHRVAGTDDVPQRASLAARLQTRNPTLIGLVKLMSGHIEDPLDLDDLADQANLSRRQVERLFKTALAVTPAKHYMNLRLDQARSLLSETDLPLVEVAIACGFKSKAYFAKAFCSRFGCRPSSFLTTTGS